MEKKYKLTDETINLHGITLYRIEALKDFNNVKKGDTGGFVESELNLSQEGNCWIYDDGCAYENAIVTDNAQVYDNAKIHGNVHVSDDAVVCGNVHLCGDINACQYQIY